MKTTQAILFATALLVTFTSAAPISSSIHVERALIAESNLSVVCRSFTFILLSFDYTDYSDSYVESVLP